LNTISDHHLDFASSGFRMTSKYFSRQPNRPDIYNQYSSQVTLLERLQQPSILIPAILLIFTAFYQSLHSSPFSSGRHPGELLWDFVIAIIPAWLLYLVDDFLNPSMIPIPKSLRPPRPGTYAAKSELLRRILGMDNPGGIMRSVASVGRKGLATLSSSTLSKRNTNQPAGLGNYDNSCFQNSILQGLSSLKPLPTYLASALEGTPHETDEEQGGSASTLQRLIAQLRDTDNNGKVLWTPAKLKSLDTWEQQDAQEYFSKLLDEIEKEAAKAAKALYKPPGLESAAARDDTEDSQHSDDSGYQSQSVLSKTNPELKVVRNPLDGMAAQRVACVQCGFSEGLSMIPFNCLTLNLGVGTMQHDLYELLDSYTHLEPIEGVECPKCTLLKVQRLLNLIITRGKDIGTSDEQLREPISRLEAVNLALEEDDFEEKTLKEKCKISAQHRSSSTKTKQVVIARPPQSLAIHMNRSVFDEQTGRMWKNLSAVKFPITLDLGPWCLGSAAATEIRQDGTGTEAEKSMSASWSDDEERWLSDPNVSMISGDVYPSKITGPIYELRAVVTHQGQHENGHYVCYRRHISIPSQIEDSSDTKSASLTEEDETKALDDDATLADLSSGADEDGDRWWRLSDENVWEVAEDAVLAQGGVFMLFYDCVEPNSVLTSEAAEGGDGGEAGATILGKAEILPASALSKQSTGSDSGEVFHDLSSDEQMPELSKGSTLPSDDDEALSDDAQSAGNVVLNDAAIEDLVGRDESSPATITYGDMDTFVSSLLSRPNATSTSTVPSSKFSAAAPQPSSMSLTTEESKDTFVSSLLSRPNS
jgi:ubiquitin carboxyl-terminal hydrolase 1